MDRFVGKIDTTAAETGCPVDRPGNMDQCLTGEVAPVVSYSHSETLPLPGKGLCLPNKVLRN